MGPVRKFSSIVLIAVNFSLRGHRDNSVTITILHSYIMYNVHCTVIKFKFNYNIIIEFKFNYIMCIQIANSICQKAVRVVLKVRYPVSCNPIKDIMVSFDG